jgi:hypothetical protein
MQMNRRDEQARSGSAVFHADGINIRHRPRLDAPVVGHAFTGQHATLICYTNSDPVNGCDQWFLLTNIDTGVSGYVAVGAARFANLVWTNPRYCPEPVAAGP